METTPDIVNYAPAATGYQRAKRRDRRRPYKRVSPKLVRSYRSRSLPVVPTRALVRSAEIALRRSAEIKTLYNYIDEMSVEPYTGEGFLQCTGYGQTSNSTQSFNSPDQGVAVQNRIGNTIMPIDFEVKGHISFTLSTNASHRESIVRVVWGFHDDTTDLAASDELLIKGGATATLSNDFTDLYADFDWKKFRPFYDELHTITPQVYVDVTTPTNYSIAKGRDYAFFNCKHKFKPGTKISWDKNNTSNGMARSKNIVGFVVARNLQDDTIITTNMVEISGFTKFRYTDA